MSQSGIILDVDFGRMDRAVRDLAGRIRDLRPVARDFGGHMVRKWSIKFPKIGKEEQSTPGEPPAVRRGGFRRSLTYNVIGQGEAVEVGTPLVYGAIQHFGGTIRPRTAKALTIPLTKKARGKRARDFKDLQFRPASAKAKPNIIGVLGVESKKGFTPMFALAREVTLPARPWAILYEEDQEYVLDRLEEHVAKGL